MKYVLKNKFAFNFTIQEKKIRHEKGKTCFMSLKNKQVDLISKSHVTYETKAKISYSIQLQLEFKTILLLTFTIHSSILQESINLTSRQPLGITEQIFSVDTDTELAEANREHP